MANGHVLWRHPTPDGKMAVLARGLGRQARRPRDGRARLGARPQRRPPRLALRRRLADRVVARSSATGSTTSAPGTAGSTRSICAGSTCAGGSRRAARSPRPPRISGGDALHRRLLRQAARAAARDRCRALGRQRQRAHLRHAGGGRRPRLRAELERRLDDRRSRPSGRLLWQPHGRLLRLLVACGLERPCLLRLVRRRLLRRLGRDRQRRSGRCPPAARSRAPPWSSTASPMRARSRTGSSASTRAPAACCSTSRTAQYVPVSGDGGRLLLHGYSRLYAVVPR